MFMSNYPTSELEDIHKSMTEHGGSAVEYLLNCTDFLVTIPPSFYALICLEVNGECDEETWDEAVKYLAETY